MNEALKTYDPATSLDTPNVISLQGSGSGHTPCDKLVGLMSDQCGLGLALASHSARQVREMGLLTSGTCGQPSSTSSSSARLALSLANRLRVTLRLRGSTLYKLTWKIRVTPAGRRIYALRASAPRTLDNAYSGWVTPNTRDWKDTPGQTILSKNPDGSKRVRLDQTPRQAAQWVGFGGMQSGSISETGKAPCSTRP